MSQDDLELIAAFGEAVNNGGAINWRYWVQDMPTLTSAQAARLLCALDPDLFENLSNRPNKNDPSDSCKVARDIERLALAQGLTQETAANWLIWADKSKLKIAYGFGLAVAEFKQVKPNTEPQAAPALPADTATAPVVQPDNMTPRQVAINFDGLPYTAENWPKRLSGTAWLQSANTARGEVGGIPSLWCPLKLAVLIHGHEKGQQQKKTLETLNSRFKRNTALQAWRDAWNEHYALCTDTITDTIDD